MKDPKYSKLSYRKQLDELTKKTTQVNFEITVDELVLGLKNVIENIDFSDKFKIIRDIIDKVTIIERSGVEICAHLPLPVTITEKLGYEPQSRNTQFTIPSLDFKFKFRLPKPRKARLITERDWMGRILHSRTRAIQKRIISPST